MAPASPRPSPAAMSLNATSDDPTPVEVATLQTDLRFVFASTLLCSSLYGAYLVISIISTYLLVQRQRLQGGQRLMLAYTGLAFVLATISHAIQSWVASLVFTEAFFQDVTLDYCSTPRALERLAMTLNLLCADGLLLYRTYKIWDGRLRVLAFPTILYVIFAVLSLIINVKCIPAVASWFQANDQQNWLSNIWTLLSVVFTVLSTALIAWRLLGARTARLALHATGQAARARKVALLLTESALLYTASGIVFAALNIADPEGNLFVSNLFFTIFMDMAYLNPAIMILRVALHSSSHGETLPVATRPLHASYNRLSEPSRMLSVREDMRMVSLYSTSKPGNGEDEDEPFTMHAM